MPFFDSTIFKELKKFKFCSLKNKYNLLLKNLATKLTKQDIYRTKIQWIYRTNFFRKSKQPYDFNLMQKQIDCNNPWSQVCLLSVTMVHKTAQIKLHGQNWNDHKQYIKTAVLKPLKLWHRKSLKVLNW